MGIQYTTRLDGNTLFVRASGFDESLEEVEAYAAGIIDACLQCSVSRVLCDETRLEYRLGTAETFDAGKFLVSRVPGLLKIAIVCNPAFNADARFFENVVVNRGLTLQMFTDTKSAKRWLEKPGNT